MLDQSEQSDVESEAEGLDEEGNEVETETGNSMMHVYHEREEEGGEPNFYMYKSRSIHKDDTEMDNGAIAFLLDLQEKIQEQLLGYNLPIYTEHRRDGQLFWGHPNY